MDFQVTFEHFNSNEAVPEEFDTCILIVGNSIMMGTWDKSTIGCLKDKRGSFFDGIGGHIELSSVTAWKSVAEGKITKRA
jgi:hypothetical protein